MYSRSETLRAMGRLMARMAQETAQTLEADGAIEAAPLLKPWTAGSMTAPVNYAANDVRTEAGQPWRCVQAHAHHGEEGWNPAASRALWSPYHATRQSHALPYVAPSCASDAYNAGEWMVWTDGLAYQALRDAVDRGPDELPDAWKAGEEMA